MTNMLPRPMDSLEPSKQQSSKKRNRSNTRSQGSAKKNVATHGQLRVSARLLEKKAANTGQKAPVATSTSRDPGRPSQSPRRSPSSNSRIKRLKPELSNAETIRDIFPRKFLQELQSKLKSYSSQQELYSELRKKLKRLHEAAMTALKNEDGERRARELIVPKMKEIEENYVNQAACHASLLKLETGFKAIDEQLSKTVDEQHSKPVDEQLLETVDEQRLETAHRLTNWNDFKGCVERLQANVSLYENLEKTKTELDGRLQFEQLMANDSTALQISMDENGWNIDQTEKFILDDRRELQGHLEMIEAGAEVDEVLKRVPPKLPFEDES